MKTKSYLLLNFLLIGFFISACSHSYYNNIDRGSGYNYVRGAPEMRALVTSFIDEQDSTKIQLTAEVVFGSLIYKKVDQLFTTEVTVDIVAVPKTDNTETSLSKSFSITLEEENQNIVYSQDTFIIERTYGLKPGEYQVSITITDTNSGKESRQTSTVVIPDPFDTNASNLTDIHVYALTNGSYEPITTYDLPISADSIKFSFQLTNNDASSPIVINTRLLKFESDQSVSRPISFADYSPSSLPYRGIDYGRETVISTSRRTILDSGSVLIEIITQNLDRGNYRFEASFENRKGKTVYKAREFSIKSPNYPAIKSARELAQPLAYLMSAKEYKKLMSITDDDSLKQAVDRFWLQNIGNSSLARQVINLYYERVEEANKQFSNYKEGWKTDPGQIYILFGPPWYVIDTTLGRMEWRYTYNQLADPEYVFYFTTPKLKNKYYPFYNFILSRSEGYFSVRYQQVQKWLSGNILNEQL